MVPGLDCVPTAVIGLRQLGPSSSDLDRKRRRTDPTRDHRQQPEPEAARGQVQGDLAIAEVGAEHADDGQGEGEGRDGELRQQGVLPSPSAVAQDQLDAAPPLDVPVQHDEAAEPAVDLGHSKRRLLRLFEEGPSIPDALRQLPMTVGIDDLALLQQFVEAATDPSAVADRNRQRVRDQGRATEGKDQAQAVRSVARRLERELRGQGEPGKQPVRDRRGEAGRIECLKSVSRGSNEGDIWTDPLGETCLLRSCCSTFPA